MSTSPGAPAPLRRTLLLFAAGLVAAFGGALAARHLLHRDAPPPTQVAAVYGQPRPVPPFLLEVHDGSRLDPARLRGRWTFVFFGYTNCPDVCPTTLLELAQAKRSLADLPADRQPAVVMVSVDPRRDTRDVLARYVPHFDPMFLGASASPEALLAFATSLGAVFQLGPEVDGSYPVDHTAALFLLNPEVELAAVFPSPHVAATIAADYRRIVAARESR